MPQLDLAYFPSQILWLIVSFTVLYLLSKHLILPKIESIITTRLGIIDTNLQEAAKLRDEALLLQKTLDQKQQDTHDLLTKMQTEMNISFAEEKDKQITQMHQESAKLLAKAAKDIENAIEEASKEIQTHIARNAQTIISSIAGIDATTAELNKTYNKMVQK